MTISIYDSDALISPCQTYRYWLKRRVTKGYLVFPARAVFVMLNPSVADANLDDPTIRRCRSFAKRENLDEFLVVNLYALRSTDPEGLWRHPDPVGPDNDAAITSAVRASRVTIAAWGAHARDDRVAHVVALLRGLNVPLLCLGRTKAGQPRHPLMLPGDAELQRYDP